MYQQEDARVRFEKLLENDDEKELEKYSEDDLWQIGFPWINLTAEKYNTSCAFFYRVYVMIIGKYPWRNSYSLSREMYDWCLCSVEKGNSRALTMLLPELVSCHYIKRDYEREFVAYYQAFSNGNDKILETIVSERMFQTHLIRKLFKENREIRGELEAMKKEIKKTDTNYC